MDKKMTNRKAVKIAGKIQDLMTGKDDQLRVAVAAVLQQARTSGVSVDLDSKGRLIIKNDHEERLQNLESRVEEHFNKVSPSESKFKESHPTAHIVNYPRNSPKLWEVSVKTKKANRTFEGWAGFIDVRVVDGIAHVNWGITKEEFNLSSAPSYNGEFFWMISEFNVPFIANTLGTAYTSSGKRLVTSTTPQGIVLLKEDLSPITSLDLYTGKTEKLQIRGSFISPIS